MKLLLDECLPIDLRHDIPGHDVFTVGFMGWKGVKNGQLLSLAASDGFDALITTDRNIEHQQNLTALPVAVIVLHTSNDLNDLRLIVPNLLRALTTLSPNVVTHVHQ
jgi:predicted nuclease of predicted toxin-antitoxin system